MKKFENYVEGLDSIALGAIIENTKSWIVDVVGIPPDRLRLGASFVENYKIHVWILEVVGEVACALPSVIFAYVFRLRNNRFLSICFLFNIQHPQKIRNLKVLKVGAREHIS